MINRIAKALPIFILVVVGTVYGQKIGSQGPHQYKPESRDPRAPTICYVGDELDLAVYPSEEVMNKIRTRTKGAEIEVIYQGFDAFPPAKEAFQYAVDTWAALIESPIKIRVLAIYQDLGDPQVLGAASPVNVWRNFTNTPKWNAWFPVALAEKIAGKELNDPDEFEIQASFNQTANWYFDTANPQGIAGGQTDFASVVMHELAHGIGFFATVDIDDDGNGIVGLDGQLPMTYTTFAEDGDGNNLVKDIDNNSEAMADALTGDQLFFKGLRDVTDKVRLHAPSSFSAGSSFSHIDNQYSDSPNELMTFSIGTGKVIHSPGIALDMLQDMGWEFTYMLHTPLESTEDTVKGFDFLAEVTSDIGFDTSSLVLHYSFDDFDKMDSTIQMLPTANLNEYKASMFNPGKGFDFIYYLEVVDSRTRKFTNPGQAPDQVVFAFRVDIDDSIPEIDHTPTDFVLSNVTKLEISAAITDYFMGVDSAFIAYSLNDGAMSSIELVLDTTTSSTYNAIIELPALSGGDVIKYQITARDKSKAQNLAISPDMGFYEVSVNATEDPVMTYSNDFNSESDDFLGTQFKVMTTTGFSDGALHSPHPYEEADPEIEFDYISQLKIPIIVSQENRHIQFREVVLVEPGEKGTVFGSDEFWDYVVVEGSKDQGETWLALEPGYDSRAKDDWESLYNDTIDPSTQISSGQGNSRMYKLQTIDFTQNSNISPGDTLLIRFRLYSDQLAAGWGWVIDDLVIQGELVTAIEDYIDVDDRLVFYPNPSNEGVFNVKTEFKKVPPTIRFTVIDVMGKMVHFSTVKGTLKLNHQIDLTNQPPGVYIATAFFGNDHHSTKLIKAR